MAYKQSKGEREFGDIEFEDDGDTKIDFEQDYISMQTGGNSVLVVSGSQVGVGTASPSTTLSIAGSVSANVTAINASSNNSSTYTVAATDYAIVCNTRPSAQNGIDSALTITLPAASDYPGRILIIKDAGGYSGTNAITLQRAGSDTINGNATTLTLPDDAGGAAKQLLSAGGGQWFEI
jgi:hypothetical protein